MLVLNIAITLPVYEGQIIQSLCLWLTAQTHVRGQRISTHIYIKLFKKIVLSSP